MVRVVMLVLAAFGGAVVGFLLGGAVATGTDAGESGTALFQTAGALTGALLACAAVAIDRKRAK
jgi:hypothetical protein